ncbi:MAG: alpha/beta fold hydrolase [Actinomycetota bacterium]
MTTNRRRRSLLAVGAVLSLLAAACSGDDAEPTDAASQPTATAADVVLGEPTPTSEAATEPTASATTEPDPEASAAAPDSAADVGTEIVRFTTGDGEQLEATVYGSGPRGLVLAHMRSRDRSTWDAFARTAAAEGLHVLAFDFRGYGGSTGARDTSLDVDLLAAVDLLVSRGADRVVVAGASMGGTAAINVAARADLAGVVSLSAPETFGTLPALDVAADVGEPLLIVTAEGDQPYADTAVALAEVAPVSQLQILGGRAHGTNLFADHEAVLTESLLSFITDRLS